MKLSLASAFLLAVSAPALAASPVSLFDMSLPLASQLAEEVRSQCKSIGQSGVVSVVDRGGNLVLLQREEGTGPHNTLAAQRKAFTALSTKTATLSLAERAQQQEDSRNLNTLPELLLLGGGVPVVYQSQTIGAVGVAGMGGAKNDHQCAKNAIEKILKTK
ncbi:GlcG/HbpS family heme-binding protein [Candidatus Pantoea multigeneris]|uniref:Heme-binding protein n=1 Tax=Candidatus Pantoea multigeneris TaxID=2608357 RepID=A0ABX0RJG5_9GAMM|nr:heme-binding protein [Pantoea multigeneris]NIF24288.1 heme-binding protein [Pantoea multigeneris]